MTRAEETLIKWFEHIRLGSDPTNHTQLTWLSKHQVESYQWYNWRRWFRKPESLFAQFHMMAITEYQLLGSEILSECLVKCRVSISHRKGTSIVQMTVVCEEEPYKARLWGKWGVNPNSYRPLK